MNRQQRRDILSAMTSEAAADDAYRKINAFTETRTELKPRERRLALWMDRHPRAADRIDQIVENSADYPGAATLAILIVPTLYPLTLAAVIVALILGHPWNWIAGAFVGSALLLSAAMVYLFFEDRRRLVSRHGE